VIFESVGGRADRLPTSHCPSVTNILVPETSVTSYTVTIRRDFPVDQPPTFAPHPNLSDEVNHCIIQSEIEGGVFLKDLPPDTVLQIQTQHHCYTAVLQSESSVLLSGHPEYCPQPVLVAIAGSTWGGSMLKQRFVGRGMRLEFCHPEFRTPIVTSSIREIRECPRLGESEVKPLHSLRQRRLSRAAGD
jgi:hypothetical protein